MSNVAGQEPQAHSRDQVALPVIREADQGEKLNISFSKGPKRKRLAKVNLSLYFCPIIVTDILQILGLRSVPQEQTTL
jgi:hypothetical protein